MAEQAVLETWKNQLAGRVVVKKRGEYGVEVEDMVPGGRLLHITEADRRMNEERAASEDLNVFRNGTLYPVKVGDRAEEFASNPNLMTEDDMRELVKAHPKTFEKRLTAISNPVVVDKILQIAHEEDCTVRRVEQIQARLEEVSPISTVKVQTASVDDRTVTTLPATNA